MPDLVAMPMIIKRLSKASNRNDLIAESQHIQKMPEHWQREQAAMIVRKKLNEFKSR